MYFNQAPSRTRHKLNVKTMLLQVLWQVSLMEGWSIRNGCWVYASEGQGREKEECSGVRRDSGPWRKLSRTEGKRRAVMKGCESRDMKNLTGCHIFFLLFFFVHSLSCSLFYLHLPRWDLLEYVNLLQGWVITTTKTKNKANVAQQKALWLLLRANCWFASL